MQLDSKRDQIPFHLEMASHNKNYFNLNEMGELTSRLSLSVNANASVLVWCHNPDSKIWK